MRGIGNLSSNTPSHSRTLSTVKILVCDVHSRHLVYLQHCSSLWKLQWCSTNAFSRMCDLHFNCSENENTLCCRCRRSVIVTACLFLLHVCFLRCVLILVTVGTCQSRLTTGVAMCHTINSPGLHPLLSFFTNKHKITLRLIAVSVYNCLIQLWRLMDRYVLFVC